MNNALWSESKWSKNAARRLLAVPSSSKEPVASGSVAYTSLSAQAVLERCGHSPAARQKSVPVVGEVGSRPDTGCMPQSQPQAAAAHAPGLSPKESFPDINTETTTTLDALLEWTMLCSAASSVFLADAQGFIIDRAGEWAFELAEATGAQVLLAFERLGKAELSSSAPRSLVVEYEDHWLTAIPVPAGQKEVYTLCLVTAAALSPGRICHVGNAVAEVLPSV